MKTFYWVCHTHSGMSHTKIYYCCFVTYYWMFKFQNHLCYCNVPDLVWNKWMWLIADLTLALTLPCDNYHTWHWFPPSKIYHPDWLTGVIVVQYCTPWQNIVKNSINCKARLAILPVSPPMSFVINPGCLAICQVCHWQSEKKHRHSFPLQATLHNQTQGKRLFNFPLKCVKWPLVTTAWYVLQLQLEETACGMER